MRPNQMTILDTPPPTKLRVVKKALAALTDPALGTPLTPLRKRPIDASSQVTVRTLTLSNFPTRSALLAESKPH